MKMDNMGRNAAQMAAPKKVGYLRQKVGSLHERLAEMSNRISDLEELSMQLLAPRPTPPVPERARPGVLRAEPFEGNSLEDRVDAIQEDANALRDRLIVLRDRLADAL
jgi:hypothetical protein